MTKKWPNWHGQARMLAGVSFKAQFFSPYSNVPLGPSVVLRHFPHVTPICRGTPSLFFTCIIHVCPQGTRPLLAPLLIKLGTSSFTAGIFPPSEGSMHRGGASGGPNPTTPSPFAFTMPEMKNKQANDKKNTQIIFFIVIRFLSRHCEAACPRARRRGNLLF